MDGVASGDYACASLILLSTRHSVVAYSVVFQRPMYLHLV